MGLLLKNNKNEVYIGYIDFGLIRQAVANSYSDKVGILYSKMYAPLFKEYSDEDNKYLDEHLPKYLDKFLYHSDCDGYFGIRDVKGIYKELLKLNPMFSFEKLQKQYNEILDLFSQGERIDIF